MLGTLVRAHLHPKKCGARAQVCVRQVCVSVRGTPERDANRGAHVRGRVLGSLSVSVCCEVCGDVCAAGRRHRWERVMSGPRAEAGNGVHRGAGRIRDTAERAEKERGGRREGNKERCYTP